MNRIQHIILLLLSITPLCKCLAQDSIKIESQLSIETKGQHNLGALNNNFDCIGCITGKVEDNPLFHLGIYTGINHLLILNDKYSIETGLYLEERSHSGGNNTLANLVVFPKILIQVEDSITKNGDVKYLIKGGDLWNEDIGDMLRIYNIDYQGLISKIIIGKFSFGFMSIGDLSKNIGLDLHQLYRFSTEYNSTKFNNNTSITINELYTPPRGIHPSGTDINIANYSRFVISNHSDLEGQLDVRLNNELNPSIAGGIRLNYYQENLKLKTALRYYSQNFNLGYNGNEPRYYGANGAFVGPQLYPLKNFYRDYSQWALYTHRPNSDIFSLELSGSWTKDIYGKLTGFCDADINYLYDLNSRSGDIFPIYNLGIQFNFLPVFNGRVSVTNKHMELRNYYQTMSISKVPFLSLSVSIKLENIRLKKMYIKS